jgi:hypothetical protein
LLIFEDDSLRIISDEQLVLLVITDDEVAEEILVRLTQHLQISEHLRNLQLPLIKHGHIMLLILDLALILVLTDTAEIIVVLLPHHPAILQLQPTQVL